MEAGNGSPGRPEATSCAQVEPPADHEHRFNQQLELLEVLHVQPDGSICPERLAAGDHVQRQVRHHEPDNDERCQSISQEAPGNSSDQEGQEQAPRQRMSVEIGFCPVHVGKGERRPENVRSKRGKQDNRKRKCVPSTLRRECDTNVPDDHAALLACSCAA